MTVKKKTAPAEKVVHIATESLANKYRPSNIGSVVGQKSVVTQLKGMFKSGKIPHAILLSGDSGCGKTTIARIIARTLNCSSLDTETLVPCGECINCKYTTGHPDVAELNMAGDERKLDSVKQVILSARNSPSIGNYRIMICDEVHQLTPDAREVILKPIEDSSPRTIWILATTEPDKLTSTILGRCHRLKLTTIEPEDMSKRLYTIAKREGHNLREVEGAEQVVKSICDISRGQMRDAVKLLEGVLYSLKSGEALDAKTVLANYFKSSDADLDKYAAQLLVALLGGDVKLMIKLVKSADDAFGLMRKLMWLVDYHLSNAVGMAKWQGASAKAFTALAKEANVKVALIPLIRIQKMLVDTEIRFYTNVDKNVAFLAAMGEYIVDSKKNA